jgi:putative FmdB family regulatory protein
MVRSYETVEREAVPCILFSFVLRRVVVETGRRRRRSGRTDMPLYEYECTQCGKRTEMLQRFDDEPLSACPACGGPVRKLVSAPAVQFKGSGWYVTDYARPNGGSVEDSAGSGSKSDASAAKNEASEAKTSTTGAEAGSKSSD